MMQYRQLGNTSIQVSRLCFGSLTISPLQAKLPLQEGVAVMKAAFSAGVNFVDTAELYNNYDIIGAAIVGIEKSIVISSKSYAYTFEDMRKSVEEACKGINRNYIDIFCLHEQLSRLTLRGHRPALDYLVQAKQDGIIRAIGVSTHTVEVVRAAALIDEIDIIHPLINYKGIGILDGDVSDMLAAIGFAKEMGKGIYAMKALAGGHLIKQAETAIQWVLKQQSIDSIAVGMQSLNEVNYNCKIFNNETIDPSLAAKVSQKQRRLLVEDWCQGCGCCVQHCPMQAISLISGKAVVDVDKCVLCGYCGAYCPEFCIKII